MRCLDCALTRVKQHMEIMKGALEKAAQKFVFYEEQHRAKGTEDADQKAVVNLEMAREMQAAIGGHTSVAAMGEHNELVKRVLGIGKTGQGE